jgi:hypothetical protein
MQIKLTPEIIYINIFVYYFLVFFSMKFFLKAGFILSMQFCNLFIVLNLIP